MIRVAQFETVISSSGIVYRPRVYGDAHAATWDGYIVFSPVTAGTVISTPPETTQRTLEDLEQWAVALDRVYLEAALARALESDSAVPAAATRSAQLKAAELSAAADAIAAADALVVDDVVAHGRAAEVAAVEAGLSRTRARAHETLAKAEQFKAQELDRQARAVAADVASRAGGGQERSGRSAAKSGRRKRR